MVVVVVVVCKLRPFLSDYIGITVYMYSVHPLNIAPAHTFSRLTTVQKPIARGKFVLSYGYLCTYSIYSITKSYNTLTHYGGIT